MQMPLDPCQGVQNCIQEETSISMLHRIFGSVIEHLITGADPMGQQQATEVLPAMLSIFNSGIVLVGGILLLFILGIGVTNSANDGEVFGRNWSPTWTSLRVVFGMGILMPSAAGYSFIQVFVLMISLWGVGLANGIHKVGIEHGILAETSVTDGMTANGMYYGIRSFAKGYLLNSYCARAANSIYTDIGPAHANAQVSINFDTPDFTYDSKGKRAYVYQIRDRNEATNLGEGKNLCGSVSLYEYNQQGIEFDNTADYNYLKELNEQVGPANQSIRQLRAAIQEIKRAEARQLMQDIDAWVATWPANFEEEGWRQISPTRFNQIVAEADNRIAQRLHQEVGNGSNALGQHLQGMVDYLSRAGWAEAGGWFQKVGLARGEIMQMSAVPVGSVSDPTIDATILSDPRQNAFKNSVELAKDVIAKATTAADENRNAYAHFDFGDIKPKVFSSTDISNAQDSISKQIEEFSEGYMSYIVSIITGANNDGTTSACGYSGRIGGSINRMKCVGDYLVVGHMTIAAGDYIARTSLLAGKVAASTTKIAPFLGEVVNAAYDAYQKWVEDVVLNLMEDVGSKLGHAAFMFSVVLPSMPYILFLIVVAGWVLGVLQTIMVVPLWALLHMTPERTFVGSQSQGYLLLLSLFVRPSLALIGLYMGILISDPMINFVVSSFFAIRGVVDGANLWPGLSHLVYLGTFLWWLTVLSYVLLAVLYMCFALPQMLPATVLSWIGGGISDPGESNAVQSVRSQMAGSTGQRIFNPLRRPKKEESLKGSASKKAGNVNSKGNQTLQGGQGTAPGNGRNAHQ